MSQAKPASEALTALRSAARDAERSAWEAGIRHDDPVGRWVSAIAKAIAALPDVLEEHGNVALAEARALTLLEVERGRQALVGAEQLTRQLEERAKIAGAIAARTHETTATDLVNQIAQGNAEAMHKTLRDEWIFAETKFHKRQLIRMGFLMALICIGMWGFGYAVAWSDGASARALLYHCLETPIFNKDNALWCRYDASDLK